MQTAFHLSVHVLPEFSEPEGVILKREIDVRSRLPARDRSWTPVAVYRDKDDNAVARSAVFTTFEVTRVDVHRDIQARAACANDKSTQLDQLADADRLQELKSTEVDGHTVRTAPPHRTTVPRLIDPFHDRAAVYLAAEVNVARLRKKAQGDRALAFWLIRLHLVLRLYRMRY